MKKSTGKVIKAFRKHLGYTQEFLADKLNITVPTLANIENGRVNADIEKLYLASHLFKIPIRDFLTLIVEVYEKGNDEGLAGAVRQLNTFNNYRDELFEN
ncbi:helix-turn-helix transcriptional regulator [Pedobacter namyangjuensis]|uniref:helix-turn-helix transcriptional regulator n=1 Tax=Pedobacter namyangjuensis TaxID=600626 RepID=UPI000DE2F2B4|nr:helix-turn-helix transcriptional regulator [Pedobacter namyangjuensis]